MTSPICLLYAGGTFGCHGTPLSALPAEVFLPTFQNAIAQPLHILNNTIVKDSSTLSPDDFLQFYHTIKQAHQDGFDKFLLITGTDTLAYLSAFLHFALAGLPLSLVITGSMSPFFEPTTTPLTPDFNSDAKDNLDTALTFLQNSHHGVAVAFYHRLLDAHSVQKLHASNPNAFDGKVFDFNQTTPIPAHTPIDIKHTDVQLYTVFCTPNSPDVICEQLNALLGKTPTAIIIIGFGAGNMPSSDHLKALLQDLSNQGFLLIMATSCPYGTTSTDYEAGAWQYALGMVSDNLPLPALYAKALWLCLTNPPQQRQQLWQTLQEKAL